MDLLQDLAIGTAGGLALRFAKRLIFGRKVDPNAQKLSELRVVLREQQKTIDDLKSTIIGVKRRTEEVEYRETTACKRQRLEDAGATDSSPLRRFLTLPRLGRQIQSHPVSVSLTSTSEGAQGDPSSATSRDSTNPGCQDSQTDSKDESSESPDSDRSTSSDSASDDSATDSGTTSGSSETQSGTTTLRSDSDNPASSPHTSSQPSASKPLSGSSSSNASSGGESDSECTSEAEAEKPSTECLLPAVQPEAGNSPSPSERREQGAARGSLLASKDPPAVTPTDKSELRLLRELHEIENGLRPFPDIALLPGAEHSEENPVQRDEDEDEVPSQSQQHVVPERLRVRFCQHSGSYRPSPSCFSPSSRGSQGRDGRQGSAEVSSSQAHANSPSPSPEGSQAQNNADDRQLSPASRLPRRQSSIFATSEGRSPSESPRFGRSRSRSPDWKYRQRSSSPERDYSVGEPALRVYHRNDRSTSPHVRIQRSSSPRSWSVSSRGREAGGSPRPSEGAPTAQPEQTNSELDTPPRKAAPAWQSALPEAGYQQVSTLGTSNWRASTSICGEDCFGLGPRLRRRSFEPSDFMYTPPHSAAPYDLPTCQAERNAVPVTDWDRSIEREQESEAARTQPQVFLDAWRFPSTADSSPIWSAGVASDNPPLSPPPAPRHEPSYVRQDSWCSVNPLVSRWESKRQSSPGLWSTPSPTPAAASPPPPRPKQDSPEPSTSAQSGSASPDSSVDKSVSDDGDNQLMVLPRVDASAEHDIHNQSDLSEEHSDEAVATPSESQHSVASDSSVSHNSEDATADSCEPPEPEHHLSQGEDAEQGKNGTQAAAEDEVLIGDHAAYDAAPELAMLEAAGGFPSVASLPGYLGHIAKSPSPENPVPSQRGSASASQKSHSKERSPSLSSQPREKSDAKVLGPAAQEEAPQTGGEMTSHTARQRLPDWSQSPEPSAKAPSSSLNALPDEFKAASKYPQTLSSTSSEPSTSTEKAKPAAEDDVDSPSGRLSREPSSAADLDLVRRRARLSSSLRQAASLYQKVKTFGLRGLPSEQWGFGSRYQRRRHMLRTVARERKRWCRERSASRSSEEATGSHKKPFGEKYTDLDQTPSNLVDPEDENLGCENGNLEDDGHDDNSPTSEDARPHRVDPEFSFKGLCSSPLDQCKLDRLRPHLMAADREMVSLLGQVDDVSESLHRVQQGIRDARRNRLPPPPASNSTIIIDDNDSEEDNIDSDPEDLDSESSMDGDLDSTEDNNEDQVEIVSVREPGQRSAKVPKTRHALMAVLDFITGATARAIGGVGSQDLEPTMTTNTDVSAS